MNCTWDIRCGDVLDQLRKMPNESVHAAVTSPPYWSLRSYDCDGEIGLERTPEEYVWKLVEVFRELRRVLRSDGTLWLNMGDSYAGGGRGKEGLQVRIHGSRRNMEETRRAQSKRLAAAALETQNPMNSFRTPDGYKRKDLLGLPWEVAIALRKDGWWLRSEVVWHKPNPTPEPVLDRPARSHEHLFLLAKSESYFYDHVAVLEPVTGNAHVRGTGKYRKMPDASTGVRANARYSLEVAKTVVARNRRTVWTIPTQPFPGEHFATFPEGLVEPCLRAATSERGCCSACGAPVLRVSDRRRLLDGQEVSGAFRTKDKARPTSKSKRGHREITERATLGWVPGCKCGAPTQACVVLDPFSGAATTCVVALKLGRSYVGLDISPAYCALSRQRLEKINPLFATPAGERQPKLVAIAGGAA